MFFQSNKDKGTGAGDGPIEDFDESSYKESIGESAYIYICIGCFLDCNKMITFKVK